jgi:excisionase family DNA binding protein
VPSPRSSPVYVTTRDAARLLGVSAPTVIQWVERGLLRAHRTPGGHRRILVEDLRALAGTRGASSAATVPDGPIVVLDSDPLRAARFAVSASRDHGVRVACVTSVFEAGLWLVRLDAVALVVEGGIPGVDVPGLARVLEAAPGFARVPVVVTGERGGAVSLERPVDEVLAVIASRVRGYRARGGRVRSRNVGGTSRSG